MPTRVISGSLALIAFAMAIVAGLVVDNPAPVTLWRALVSMIAAWLIGEVMAAVVAAALRDQVNQALAPSAIAEATEHLSGAGALSSNVHTASTDAMSADAPMQSDGA